MVKKKVLFLIQSRIYSTRLPGKNFFNFFNENILERVIRIAKSCVNKNNIFILTGGLKKNKILKYVAKKHQVKIFFGDEKNVNLRFKKFLKKNRCDFFYRVTADNYLIQPQIVRKMLNDLKNFNFDYSYVKPLSHYSGELVNTKYFLKYRKISKLSEEHVTWDIRSDKKVKSFAYKDNFMGLDHKKSITLDCIEDLIFMKEIEKKYPNLKKIDCVNEVKKIKRKT